MPPAKTAPLTSGDNIEARVAQLWFWEGYFARSGIDLKNQYGAELVQVTDLDLLAYSFGPNLENRKTIGESKSGGKSAPKPLDRIVWLRGMQSLVGADAAELTVKASPTSKVRELGRHLRVSVQSIADLEAREEQIGVRSLQDSGSQGPTAASMRNMVRAICADDPHLVSAFQFLRSSVWFLDPYSAAKQTLGLLAVLSKRWTPKYEDEEKQALRWLLAEAIAVFAFNVTVIAGHISPMSPDAFKAHLRERLADGIVSSQKMRQVAKDIDKYIAGIMTAANASPTLRTQAMGAFEPAAPPFADSLAELALRIKLTPTASQFPRQVDFMIHERLVRRRQPQATGMTKLAANDAPLIQALAAFLRNYAGLPTDINSALTGRTADEGVVEPLTAEAEDALMLLAAQTDASSDSLFELDEETSQES